MKTVCDKDCCTGCMACVDKCKLGALKVECSFQNYNVVIDESKCIKCGACMRVCPNNSEMELKEPLYWQEGWANDSDIRRTSSSGGFATAIMKAFVENGGVVCSCVFKDGEFIFEFCKDVENIKKFQGSKYVKSNPTGIYKEIETVVKKRKILFIGLPCQVAAVKKIISPDWSENLYTIDLICHGTPSPLLLEKYLKEHGYSLKNLTDIRFRKKGYFNLSDKEWQPIVNHRIADKYTYSFLHALNYTENCYHCKYARTQRISDCTIGDSWGTKRKSELNAGISLALVQTVKGKELLDMADLTLFETDSEQAVKSNRQLVKSSIKSNQVIRFYKAINAGKRYDTAVWIGNPYGAFKQKIKRVLASFLGGRLTGVK